MNRRRVIAAGAAAILTPLASVPQESRRMSRIGFLGAGSAVGFANQIAGLRAGLRDFGYSEGKNIAIEFRWAEGKLDRLPALAGELVRLPVEVLVTQGIPATRAAKDATTKIPIVMAAVGDAAVMGIVPSLAKPGANITGSTFFAPELVAKRLELLRSALQNIKRIGVPFNPDNPLQRGPVRKALDMGAASLGLELEHAEARSMQEFEKAVSAVAAKRVDAVIFSEEPMQLINATALVDIAMRHRLPSIGPLEFVPAGVLMAYGVNFPELYRRAAAFVDKILKGARPADLPIEQATRFDLVMNLKSARALGLTIPGPLVQRADKVLE
jgi:putative tryptophan/tyrosine transport system substrate-binding protein